MGTAAFLFLKKYKLEKILHFEVGLNWKIELLNGDCTKQKRLKN
jgi:hypothetical protein